MARESRRPDPSLIDALVERPAAFDFFQAVRLLELRGAARGRAPVGFDHDPRAESVRLKGHPSLAFPAGEIREVRNAGVDGAEAARPAEMRVTFLGFLGAMGVLPQHYTELVVRRLQRKDSSLLDWLDLLLHRTLSLLHRAWWKHRPAFSFEQSRRHGVGDPTRLALRALAGLATGKLAGRLALPDESLLFFAGQLSTRRRSAAGLARVAGAWLRMPARVKQFAGRWLEIEPGDRSLLPSSERRDGRHARLGRDLVLGARVRDVSGKVRLELGPLGYPGYLAVLPGGASHRGLRDLVRTWLGIGLDCDLKVDFERDGLPRTTLTRDARAARGLGRDAWLGDPRRAGAIRGVSFPLTSAGGLA
jgi:type VI secretion system protein ImpH